MSAHMLSPPKIHTCAERILVTHERSFLWMSRSFWDRGRRTPNFRIHAECSNYLSYRGQTSPISYFCKLLLNFRINKIVLITVNCNHTCIPRDQWLPSTSDAIPMNMIPDESTIKSLYNHTQTKQTKPCAYFMWYTVHANTTSSWWACECRTHQKWKQHATLDMNGECAGKCIT